MNCTAQLDPSAQLHKTVLAVGPGADVAGRMAGILPDWKIERALTTFPRSPSWNRGRMTWLLREQKLPAEKISSFFVSRLVRPHIRLIIIASESTPADVIASMRERAFSYFSQPFSWTTFAEMVLYAAEQPCWDDGIEVLSATPPWIRLAVRCDVSTADRLLQFFHEIADLPDAEMHKVGTALREMLLNAIEHGGRFDPKEYVEVSYVRAQHMVGCRVKDPGQGFSLKEVRHSAITNPPDDPIRHLSYREAQGIRPGGFGVQRRSSYQIFGISRATYRVVTKSCKVYKLHARFV